MRMTFEAQYVQPKGKKLLHEGSWSNFGDCQKTIKGSSAIEQRG